MYERIPEELKCLSQWVCWKGIPEETGKVKKIPINPHTGGQAQSNNPQTWSNFSTAVRASAQFSGIGFMFNDNGYFGVDLDGIESALEAFRQDEKDNIVSEFVHTLQSYTELSQSGKGIHIICKGKLPAHGRRKGNVEMYQSGRFFVMTGNICAEYADITDCTESIKHLHEKYIGGGTEPVSTVQNSFVYTGANLCLNEIVEAARKSKQGEMFNDLLCGNYDKYYKSPSEADLGFCNMLAFWCGRDTDKMDAIFRQSGLMREKWDRQQSRSTYGKITIKKAVDSCANVYNPKSPQSEYRINISGEKPEKIKLYSFDDTGNAQRIIDMFGQQIRYYYTDKEWKYYDGRKWCGDVSGAIKRIADASIEAMKKESSAYAQMDEKDGGDMEKQFMKHMKASRSSKSKNAMIKEAEHNVPLLPIDIDRHKMLFNTPNGIINLKTGALMPHDSEKYLTKISGTEYTDNADCPLWERFLDDIFDGDKELIRYVQKAVGYSLSGSTQEQCAFFLYGTGRNGKSTFLDVIRDIFGDYASNIQPETIMIRGVSSGSASSDIARLKGARLVTSVEPNEGVRINEGLLKQLTGEDPVTTRKLYGNEFEFKPEFKLWMATNHKPIIRGTDIGIWRRIHMIPFTVQIPMERIDRHLSNKLKKELPAIFKWAVDGGILYLSEGLRMPKSVLEAVREYQSEMDVISAFIEACCITGEGEVKASQLYAVYAKWCDENNEYKMSNTKFGREMVKRFEKTKNGYGYIYYKGISLGDDSRPYSISVG